MILYEGAKHRAKLSASLMKLATEPKQGLEEVKGFLNSKKETILIGSAIEKQHRLLLHQVRSFILQLSDFVRIDVVNKQQAFALLKRLLNFSRSKLNMRGLSTTRMSISFSPTPPLSVIPAIFSWTTAM